MKAIRNSQKDSQYCETKVSEFPTSFLIVKPEFWPNICCLYVFCISDKLGSLTLAQFVAKYLSRFHDSDCYLLFAGMVRFCTTTAYRGQTVHGISHYYKLLQVRMWLVEKMHRNQTKVRGYKFTYRSLKRDSIQLRNYCLSS